MFFIHNEQFFTDIKIVKLDFLDEGKKYVATIYGDGKDADYKTNPQSYTITEKNVTNKTTLKILVVMAGGCTVSFEEE